MLIKEGFNFRGQADARIHQIEEQERQEN